MKYTLPVLAFTFLSTSLFAAKDPQLQQEIVKLQKETRILQGKLNHLQKQLQTSKSAPKQQDTAKKQPKTAKKQPPLQSEILPWHTSNLSVQLPNDDEKIPAWYPIGLVADSTVITWIASTPVVLSPYTGERPAFDGSDYLVNISSINRDVRLMEQRKRLYDAYAALGYPMPDRPIMALSGKLEPFASAGKNYLHHWDDDLTLGSAEIDVAVLLNTWVEAFASLAYDNDAPAAGGPRVTNSSFDLALGFVNIGNPDETPLYFTAGQLYAPYGRYSSAMISAPLTLRLARNLARPVILGYKTQDAPGPFVQLYGFKSDTTLGKSGNGGITTGFTYDTGYFKGEIGGSYVHSIDDADGMQLTFFGDANNFGGFGSPLRGNEYVKKVHGADIYGIVRFDRFNLTAEWVGAIESFRFEDLSFGNRGAKPQAGQLEAGATFMVFDRPASVGLSYQWTHNALALGLPKKRINSVFNISIWKDTVESIEFRHDVDYGSNQFANGASPVGRVNVPIQGTGGTANTLLAQLGVYF